MDAERDYCSGVVLERRLHIAEAVGHYVITNTCAPFMCIQADWYHPLIQTRTSGRTSGQSLGLESSFLLA